MENYKDRIKNLYNEVIYSALVEDAVVAKKLEEAFPEFKPSKDESIRKAIIDFIKVSKPEWENCRDYTSWVAWLEKQGEQKPILDFKASNFYVSKIDGKIHDMTYNPTNKFEPKFKVGDYIVSDYCMGRIVEITNDAYLLDAGQGISFSCEDKVHLWTIADAKDGDVLSWDDSKCIAIFKNIYDEDSFNSYGFVGGCTGTFESRQSYHDIEGAHPASKEQYVLLFQKMKEAGYEWDAEKKELKKVEQKSSWSEEDETRLTNIIIMLKEGASYHFIKDDITKAVDWLKSLKQRIRG